MLLAGCGKQEVFLFPDAPAQTGHFMGSPLAPPATRPVMSFQPREALQVEVSAIAFSSMPETLGELPATRTRFITSGRTGRPVRPSTLLTRGARLLSLPEPGALDAQIPAKVLRAAGPSTRTALDEGVTFTLRFSEKTGSADAVTGADLQRGVQVALHRPATRPTTLQLALTVDDLVIPRMRIRQADKEPESSTRPAEASDADAASARARRETALIEFPWTNQTTTYALVVPFDFAQRQGEALTLLIRVSPGDDSPDHAAALRSAQKDVQESGRLASGRPTTLPAYVSQVSALRIALDSLKDPERRRAALVFLAAETHAPIAADVALSADDAMLGEIAGGALAAVEATGYRDALDLGWILERHTMTRLGKLMAADALPRELSTVLVFHLGEAGRQSGSFEELQRSTQSREKFAARLLAENLILLEDVSAASRVRAHQWLVARKFIIPGYDPEAPAVIRRAALEKFYAQPPTGAGQ